MKRFTTTNSNNESENLKFDLIFDTTRTNLKQTITKIIQKCENDINKTKSAEILANVGIDLSNTLEKLKLNKFNNNTSAIDLKIFYNFSKKINESFSIVYDMVTISELGIHLIEMFEQHKNQYLSSISIENLNELKAFQIENDENIWLRCESIKKTLQEFSDECKKVMDAKIESTKTNMSKKLEEVNAKFENDMDKLSKYQVSKINTAFTNFQTACELIGRHDNSFVSFFETLKKYILLEEDAIEIQKKMSTVDKTDIDRTFSDLIEPYYSKLNEISSQVGDVIDGEFYKAVHAFISSLESELYAQINNNKQINEVIAGLEKIKSKIGTKITIDNNNNTNLKPEISTLATQLTSVDIQLQSKKSLEEFKNIKKSLNHTSVTFTRINKELKELIEKFDRLSEWYNSLDALYRKLCDPKFVFDSTNRRNFRQVTSSNFKNILSTLNISHLKSFRAFDSTELANLASLVKVTLADETKCEKHSTVSELFHISGHFIKLSDHLSAAKVRQISSEFIFIECFNTIWFDTNVCLEGKSLVISAPKWYIPEKVSITSNGEDAKEHARSVADTGCNGEAGKTGGSAGCFYGFVRKTESTQLSNLSVSLKGGNGGRGQDGGKGKDGENGADATSVDRSNYSTWSKYETDFGELFCIKRQVINYVKNGEKG